MKKNKCSGKLLMLLTFVFLYLPIAVLIVFSFNDSKSRTVWSGFTLNWYKELFSDRMIIQSLEITLLVSVLASLIAVVVGTFAAIGFFNGGIPDVHAGFGNVRTDSVAFDKGDDRLIWNLQSAVGGNEDFISCGNFDFIVRHDEFNS